MSNKKGFMLANSGGDQHSAIETLGDSTADLLKTSVNKSKQDPLQESSLFPSVHIESARPENFQQQIATKPQPNDQVAPILHEPNSRNRIG